MTKENFKYVIAAVSRATQCNDTYTRKVYIYTNKIQKECSSEVVKSTCMTRVFKGVKVKKGKYDLAC